MVTTASAIGLALLCLPVAVVVALLYWIDEASLYRYRSDGRPGPAPTRSEPEPARSAWVTPPVVVVLAALVALRALTWLVAP
jgi:hypothetical protein